MIEFPAFQVAPGTRRGVVPDAAADAFAQAMAGFAPLVEAELARFERERQATTSRQLLAELRRALRGLRARLPQYELPKVEPAPSPDGVTPVVDGGGAAPAGVAIEPDGATDEAGAIDATDQPPSLFPPGPLSAVRIVPSEITVQAGRERRVQAVATDQDGRRVPGQVAYGWSSDHEAVAVVGDGPKPLVRARADARPPAWPARSRSPPSKTAARRRPRPPSPSPTAPSRPAISRAASPNPSCSTTRAPAGAAASTASAGRSTPATRTTSPCAASPAPACAICWLCSPRRSRCAPTASPAARRRSKAWSRSSPTPSAT